MKPMRRAIPVKSSRIKQPEELVRPGDEFNERDWDVTNRRQKIRQGQVAPKTGKEFDGLGHEDY